MKQLKTILLGIIAVFMLASCERIDAGHVGLKVNMTGGDRGVSNIKYVTGWVWYLPWATKIVEVPTFVQHKEYEPVAVYAKGGIGWTVHPAINYQVNTTKADSMFETYRVTLSQLEDGWMKNVVYQVCRDALNTFDSDSLLNHRDQFEQEMAKELQRKLTPFFIVSNVTSGLTPPDALTAAIKAKTVAIQAAQAAENEKLVAIKQGEANVAQAQAAATVKITEAEADAKAITLKQEALKQSPQYIDLIKAEKWNGQLPQIVTSGNGGLFMQLPNK